MTRPAVTSLPEDPPAFTLGWEVLWWTTRYIRQPDGPNVGEEWRFTPEQVRFILQWYAISEEGRWRYVRGVLRRSKGWGKTPLVSALALAELCGPVRFDRFALGGETRPWRTAPYEAGEVIGRPVAAAWVQLAGVSLDQTKNTMSMVLAMCAESPIVEAYGLDLGLTRIYTGHGGRLEPITASAPTAEGARPTAIYQDETQHYNDSNRGTELDRVDRRNLSKTGGRLLETTNAHAAGEDSVAERSYKAWLAGEEGRSRTAMLLYDSREAPADINMADEDDLMSGLEAAYGDSYWVDLTRIRDEVWDPSTPASDSRRYFLNQISAAVDAWIAEPEWAGCADPTKVVHVGDTVVLGFDGSRQRTKGVTDATALIGCRVSDGHLFEIGVWEQPLGPAGVNWAVPQAEVEAAVDMAFSTWNVVGLFADPTLWDGVVANWERRYARRLRVKVSAQRPMSWTTVQAGSTSSRMGRALQQFQSAVLDRQMTHDGSFKLTQHVLHARRRPTRTSMAIGKPHEDSAQKIDAAVAAVYCWQARLAAVAAGAFREEYIARRIR
jgi:hypothetical protein